MKTSFERTLTLLALIGLLVMQPLFVATLNTPTAQAQVDKPADEDFLEEESPDDLADIPEEPPISAGDFVPFDFVDLEMIEEISGNLVLSPQDKNYLENSQVDIRVTDYLLQLVLPESFGGYGLDHVKVNRIFKNYTSDGNGRMDREGADALSEDGGAISGHNRGQAVDISEVGTVTCKLVFKRHLGGSTTKWQKPKPIKVAWQSREGIDRNPTPTSQSLLGASGDMSAQAIVSYLNQSGEMDYYIDYVKGLDLKTIIGYVGANVYLKTWGVNKIISDPMADGLLHTLGGALLEKALPGIPPGIALGSNDDDARVAFAKARIEQGLNLPAGSLRGYGWDGVLESTGKRHLESSLGLPALYFENHKLDDANRNESVKAALDYVTRSDDFANVAVGTIEQFKKNDPKAFKMAGATLLSAALHLPADKRQALELAAKDGRTPDISLDGVPTDTVISTQDLKNMLSADPAKQREAQAALKVIGLKFVQEISKKTVPAKYAGLTRPILEKLLDPKKDARLGDVRAQVGASTMGISAGTESQNTGDKESKIGEYITKNSPAIATYLNQEFNLLDPALQISANDVKGLVQKGNFELAEKLGGIQADKAIGWNSGTTYAVINKKKTLQEASQEAFGNFVGKTLGLQQQGVSLKGNIAENYGYAIMAERLGIEQGKIKDSEPGALILNDRMGESAFKSTFRLSDGRTLVGLRDDASYWEQEDNTTRWRSLDITLGIQTGTTVRYLRGELTTKQYAIIVGQGNMTAITADRIWDYFGIDDQYRLSGDEINNLIRVLSGKDEFQTLENIENATATMNRLLGRSVDGRVNFSKDTFLEYIIAPSDASATKLLLDQGIRIVARSFGSNLDDYSFDDLAFMGERIKLFFGRGAEIGNQTINGFSLDELETLRQEYDRLIEIPESQLTVDQERRLRELERHNALQRYRTTSAGLSDFFLAATGIPGDFRVDAEAFMRGDWVTGVAAASAAALIGPVNSYLPPEGQLNYAEIRAGFIMDDPSLIEQRAIEIATSSSDSPAIYSTLTDEEKAVIQNHARRQLMEEAKRNVEYKVSDSLLRKIDPTIPIGFSRAMFSGDASDRGLMLQNYAFNHLDQLFIAASPLYVPGSLQQIYNNGGLTSEQTDRLILNIIGSSGVSFGSFTTDFVQNFYSFIRASNRQDFYTSAQYEGMWNYFDGWLEENLGIGDLPDGVTKSLYFAAQNGWNPNAEITIDGKTWVSSLNALGQDILVNRFSSWGDAQFNLPTGTVYKGYQLYRALSGAEKELTTVISQISSEGGVVAEVNPAYQNAQGKAAQAKAALILFALEVALTNCSACQKAFASIDKALAAPPGFTQAAALGAAAMMLKLGPTGLYIAAAIYLFGVYEVEYLCPKPPRDLYAIEDYDDASDRNDFGVKYEDLPESVEGSPKPGINPFDWDNGRPFSDGDNEHLWMGWARFFTGKLIESSMDYGAARVSPFKLQQLLTYRQANAEFFYPQSFEAFGDFEASNPTIGLGYTQTTTRTTDWVHVSFGGIF